MDVDLSTTLIKKNTTSRYASACRIRILKVKLTKRGKRVRAVLILLGIYFMYQIITNLWYVGPEWPTEDFLGYCWGSMMECIGE